MYLYKRVKYKLFVFKFLNGNVKIKENVMVYNANNEKNNHLETLWWLSISLRYMQHLSSFPVGLLCLPVFKCFLPLNISLPTQLFLWILSGHSVGWSRLSTFRKIRKIQATSDPLHALPSLCISFSVSFFFRSHLHHNIDFVRQFIIFWLR